MSEDIKVLARKTDQEISAASVVKGGGFSKYATIDNWIKGIKNTSSKTNVENILKKWDEDLLKQLDNIPSRNPKFLAQVESNPNILNHFEEGSKIISNKSTNLKAVELDMYALDKARTSDIIFDRKGKYITNPTRKSFDNLPESSKMDINTQSGKILDSNGSVMVTDNVYGEGIMYVIDDANNIYIGGRGGKISYPPPVLIGGVNPNDKSAGMIRFKDGRILKINNNSGHFKPSSTVLQEAKSIFRQKLPINSFDSKFK